MDIYPALRAALDDNKRLSDNLAIVHERCNELFDENRRLKAELELLKTRWSQLLKEEP